MADVDAVPKEEAFDVGDAGESTEPPKKKRRSRWGQEPSQVEGTALVATQNASVPANYPMMQFGSGVAAPTAPVAPVAPAAFGGQVDLAAAANAARDALEKAKKAAQFQKQIAEQMALLRGTIARPRKLILDEFGRELDEEGNVVPMKAQVTATLAVNANLERQKQTPGIPDKKPGVKSEKVKPDNPYFDPRMRMKAPTRKARPMTFMEQGTLVKQEQKIIRKAQDKMLEEALKSKQLQIKEAIANRKGKVKKEEEEKTEEVPIFTEIKVKKLDPIPAVEWWDKMILDEVENGTDFPFQLAERKITFYVEHPPALKAALPEPEAKVIMHLTPAERKKYRKLRKQDRTRDYQDKIKMGLTKPPPPKVKMSNLMRVLGDQAIADPSAVEKKVRAQMQERSAAHEARNEANKLAPEERRKKKIAKWRETKESEGCHVLLFKVKSLASKRYIFKIDQNAQQYHMTGFCIASPAGNMVVLEGNAKAAKRYKRLMLQRIKWGEDDEADENEDDDDDDDDDVAQGKRKQDCQLVWEGVVKERGFRAWKVLNAKSENEIRAALSDVKAEHYWDMIKRFRGAEQDL
jgi:U4/U6 small nuclear ribonucleoprotein PRP3